MTVHTSSTMTSGDMSTAAASPHQLDEYLTRIGYSGVREPTARVLVAIHRAHLATIPFENLTVITAGVVTLDHADLHAKMVHRSRGGYCYEHALLVTSMLLALGYQVETALARTGDPAQHPRPRSHLVTYVTDAEGATWLFDVGFGSGLLHPLLLASEAEHTQGAWTFRLRPTDYGLQLQQREAEDWITHYTLAQENTFLVDIEGANQLTYSSPTSPFTQRIVVVRRDEQSTTRLLGRQLTTERPPQALTSRHVDDDELARVLSSLGVDLDNEEMPRALRHPSPPG